MILHFLGCPNVTESQIKTYGGSHFTYVYKICQAINHFLSVNGIDVTYSFQTIGEYNDGADIESFYNLVKNCLEDGHPIQMQLNIIDTLYFPYTSDGHYVLVVGYFKDPITEEVSLIINDPHPTYCAQRVVSLVKAMEYCGEKKHFIISAN